MIFEANEEELKQLLRGKYLKPASTGGADTFTVNIVNADGETLSVDLKYIKSTQATLFVVDVED